jgi:hypothetical protein
LILSASTGHLLKVENGGEGGIRIFPLNRVKLALGFSKSATFGREGYGPSLNFIYESFATRLPI